MKINIVAIALFAISFNCSLSLSYPWYFSQHGIDAAHHKNILGDNIKIAILDTPVHLAHPSLQGSKEEYCHIAATDARDASVHGTAVTSIIGGKPFNDYPDFIGVAPNAIIATFGVPERHCGVEIVEEALNRIRQFKPNIINVSSNVLNLSDAKILVLLEQMVEENPSLVIVVAAGNEGYTLQDPLMPCMAWSKEKATQAELECLRHHNLKDNFVLVGNLAMAADINYGDLLLLPDNHPSRERSDTNFSARTYSLAHQLPASQAANIINEYIDSVKIRKDYFSSFYAFFTYLLTKVLSETGDDHIIYLGGKINLFGGEIPSDHFIRWRVAMDSIADGYSDDNQRIESEIARRTAKRDFKKSLEVKALKLEFNRKEMLSHVDKIEFVTNDKFKAMSQLFVRGLPDDNANLLALARDFIPIRFVSEPNTDTVLHPSSTRAGVFDNGFMSAMGTNIPAASIRFADEDINRENPIYEVAKFTGTSFAAPIVAGSIALIAQACNIDPKQSLFAVYNNAIKDDRWVFGQGMLNLRPILEKCTSIQK